MGYYVKINSDNTRKYEAVSPTAFKNFLGFAKSLKFKKLSKLGSDVAIETYYDTPTHLLNKSGIILSKFQEGNNLFFKVEKTTHLSKMLNKLTKEAFVHKVGSSDSLADHAFYIKDGITSLFTTAFSIDLENVIKNAEPKMEVKINADIYMLASGTGMRAKVALENKTVTNFETKRKFEVKSMTIKLTNETVELFKDDFDNFNSLVQKNCKEFLLVDENQFDFATKVTKAIPPKVKEKKNAADKKKANKIQG